MIEWILLLSLIGLIILGIQIKDYKYPSQIQKEIIKEFNKEWEQIKMTENRFDLTDHPKNIIFDFNIGEPLTQKQVMNLLNELHTENKELKKQLESEHIMLDNAILLERTRMGQSALKQYKEAIQ